MRRIALAVSIFAASIGAASAADLAARPYTKASPIVVDPGYNWSGFYIGGQGGYAGSRNTYLLDNGLVTERFDFNPNSGIGGGHAGLQGQWGSWVLGAEGTYNVTRLRQTDLSVLLPGRMRSLKTDEIATVVGKVGYATGAWMFYVKGGWADANIDTYIINPATGINGDIRKWQSGYTVGGGVDYMFSRGWIVGADFNYYKFGFNRSGLASDGTPNVYSDTRSEVYAGTLRLSYLFNWGGPVVAKY